MGVAILFLDFAGGLRKLRIYKILSSAKKIGSAERRNSLQGDNLTKKFCMNNPSNLGLWGRSKIFPKYFSEVAQNIPRIRNVIPFSYWSIA